VLLYYAYDIDHLGPPVRGSTGLSGHSAAPIVRPSSVRRLYVDAALRWGHQSLFVAPSPRLRLNVPQCASRTRRDGLTESITSSCIPRLEMYSRIAFGAGTTLSPVPNRRISDPVSSCTTSHILDLRCYVMNQSVGRANEIGIAHLASGPPSQTL
jgi:hypothetical protein